MTLLVKLLILRPKQIFKLLLQQEKQISKVYKFSNVLRKKTRILRILRKINPPKIFLLIYFHYQVKLRLHQHNQPRKTRPVIFVKKNPIFKAKPRARIYLLLASISQLLKKTKTKSSQLILSIAIISKKIIIPISVLKKKSKNQYQS